jgi:hypothetical protein
MTVNLRSSAESAVHSVNESLIQTEQDRNHGDARILADLTVDAPYGRVGVCGTQRHAKRMLWKANLTVLIVRRRQSRASSLG